MFERLIRATFNWRTVRAFGSVQLLTRASYAMLVLVPLLAGIWPMAHLFFGESKRELLRYAEKLEKEAAGLDLSVLSRQSNGDFGATTSEAAPEKIGKTNGRETAKAVDQINTVAADLRHAATMLPEFLPSVWVYGFFTALVVAFGHLVYQTSAPRTVQRYSLEEYQDDRVQAFARSPTSDLINEADNEIRGAVSTQGTFLHRKAEQCVQAVIPLVKAFNERINKDDNDWRKIVDEQYIQSLIYSARRELTRIGAFYATEFLEMLISGEDNPVAKILRSEMHVTGGVGESLSYLISQHVSVPFKKEGKMLEEHNKEKIWIAARIQYLDESRSRFALSVASFGFYLVGLGLIIWLSWGQVLSVLSAAGWISIGQP